MLNQTRLKNEKSIDTISNHIDKACFDILVMRIKSFVRVVTLQNPKLIGRLCVYLCQPQR